YIRDAFGLGGQLPADVLPPPSMDTNAERAAMEDLLVRRLPPILRSMREQLSSSGLFGVYFHLTDCHATFLAEFQTGTVSRVQTPESTESYWSLELQTAALLAIAKGDVNPGVAIRSGDLRLVPPI